MGWRCAVAGDLGMMQLSKQSAFSTAPVWRGPMLKVLLSHHEAAVDLTSGPQKLSAKRSPAAEDLKLSDMSFFQVLPEALRIHLDASRSLEVIRSRAASRGNAAPQMLCSRAASGSAAPQIVACSAIMRGLRD
ncbi:hypothetical protein AK812_SmicGene41264 [Symbiodinium microadriaticum]|uniref:Uncharacterized protein n=1 Tax=Symbiodinium microadriaticum TaxID=2951 RepID=A0A1Q9C6J7_SYMMI|nr:hypothetical protein AK812_SmicGene41264 [Symbiodinium microadriaticum]